MQLENSEYRVIIALLAGECTSFYNLKHGIEYIHNGDPAHWSGRNPTLFPKVSRSNNDTQLINGTQYHMGNHGFLRHSTFQRIEQTTDSITLRFQSNEETLKEYPFRFTIDKKYTLKRNRLIISHTVRNDDEITMPFTIGHHPAFRCPLMDGEAVSDYHIAFDHPENFTESMQKADKMSDTSIFKEPISKLPLPCDRYGMKSLGFRHLKSSYVSLVGPKHGVKVSILGYPIVTLWPEASTPFFCIEPWLSQGDAPAFDGEFETKEGMIHLLPHRSFVNAYEWIVF